MKSDVSVYRCTECGNGDHLTAWAYACTFGSLAADGELAESGIWSEVVQEDSIECTVHLEGSPIEKIVDGQWCRWWVCPVCKNEKRPGWNKCPEPGLPPLAHTYAGQHEGWAPVVPAAPTRASGAAARSPGPARPAR